MTARIYEPGIYADISHDDYHADPCSEPSLSSSIAKKLAEQSPLHAWYAHPRLGAGQSKSTAANDRGSILHKLILGRGQDFEIIEAKDYRTDVAQKARDKARVAGKIPVIAAALLDYKTTAEAIRSRIWDAGIELTGPTEVTAIWRDGDVLNRARFDHWNADAFVIDDLKTCESAAPEAVARHMVTYGADIQHAHYVRGVNVLCPDSVGRARMRFIFAEADPPHAVTVVEPDGTMRELGDRRWKRAVSLWSKCTASGVWPGYAQGVVKIGAPQWALAREMESEINKMGAANVQPPPF